MEKTPLRINLEDLPDDIDSVPDDTEIVLDDHDEMMDDNFWDSIDTVGK